MSMPSISARLRDPEISSTASKSPVPSFDVSAEKKKEKRPDRKRGPEPGGWKGKGLVTV